MTNEFGKIIADYATRDVANLRMTILVAEAFDDIKRKVISSFISGLIRELRVKYQPDSWKFEFNADPLEKYSGFMMSNKKWVGKHWIGIEAGTGDARDFVIGVAKGVKTKTTVPGLMAALDTGVGRGRHHDSWEWYRNLDGPFNNWINEDALCAMLSGDAVGEFLAKSKLLEIVEIANPLLSR